MNNTPQTARRQRGSRPGTILVVIVILTLIFVSCLLLLLFIKSRSSSRQLAPQLVCGTNLKGLHGALDIYAQDNNDVYPTADNWCDLLITHTKITPASLFCRESDAQQGQSSYAMNSNASQRNKHEVPSGMVLLFEAKPGWNQHGGPEILSPDRHRAMGSNILFNDGTVEFVRTEELDKLIWKP